MSLFLIFSGLLLSLLNFLFQLLKFCGKLLFNIVKFLFDLFESGIKLLLSCVFFIILFLKLLKLNSIVFLKIEKFFVLILNLFLLILDQFLLVFYIILHVFTLFILFILVCLHVRFEVLLDFLDIVNFSFLLLEQVSGLFKLGVLIPKLVNLSLQLVRLLLFNHFHIALGNFLYFCQAAVRESITLQSNIHQGRVLVQGFEHHCFNLFAEEVVGQLDGTDLLIPFQGINQVDKSCVIEATRAKVELL